MTSPTPYNILVTGASSTNSIDFIKTLKNQTEIPLRVFVSDVFDKKDSIGSYFADKYYKVPYATDSNFIDVLFNICKSEKIDVLVPIIDEEFSSILENRELFEKINTKIVLPEKSIFQTATNKIKFDEFLKTNNLPCLQIRSSPIAEKDLPVIAKPVQGRGSRDVKIIRTLSELDSFPRNDNFILQKYITGTEFTVDTISDTSARTLVAVARIRLEIRDGKATRAKISRNTIVENMAIDICNRLKMTGPACLQCILTNDNVPYFFDFNTRIGAATRLTIEAGVNIPILSIKTILNLPISKEELTVKRNLLMLRYYSEVFCET